MKHYDVIIIGAGASGLMCASTAEKRGRKVLLLDHAKCVGKKILVSGGGSSNFTNLSVSAENYLFGNPHFCQQFSLWEIYNSQLAIHNSQLFFS